MHVLNAVNPSAEQLEALVRSAEPGPVLMLNLLKFRDVAVYDPPTGETVSGLEAYMRYGREVQKLVEAGGGKLRFSAAPKALVIGEVDQMWDAVAVVEYASPAAFVRMAISPEMQAISHHRKAGLEGQLLIMCADEDAIGL